MPFDLLVKFRLDILKRSGDMAFKRKFKMAAATMLKFACVVMRVGMV